MRPLRTTAAAKAAVPAAPNPATAPVRMHPHALDLADRRRLRPDLGLEHHLAALEPGPCPARGDESGDAAPVPAATVAEPRVDPDLADEHVDGGDQVGVEFVHPHGTHRRDRRRMRRGVQRHQRLMLTDVTGGTPRRLRGDATSAAPVRRVPPTTNTAARYSSPCPRTHSDRATRRAAGSGWARRNTVTRSACLRVHSSPPIAVGSTPWSATRDATMQEPTGSSSSTPRTTDGVPHYRDASLVGEAKQRRSRHRDSFCDLERSDPAHRVMLSLR